MREINYCPATLQEGYSTYCPAAVRELFDGKAVSPFMIIAFDDDSDQEAVQENMANLSISGAQEKFSAVVEGKQLRLSLGREQGTYILKPAPLNYNLSARKEIPANEHLTMQIARQVYGIITAGNALCFDRGGRPVYLTRRFDVGAGQVKYPIEDFASVLNMTEQGSDSNFKYHGCYAMIADALKQVVPAWPVAVDQLFRLVLFNYIFGNEDAHMKNFSLIRRNGELFMAPAYDLLNTALHVKSGSDFALKEGLSPDLEKSDAYERTGHPCRLDFERFAERIGLSVQRARRVLDLFGEIPQETYMLIDHSFLSDKMKRSYKRIIEERCQRYNRVS